MRFGRKEAARHNKLYESNSQVPGHRHFQDEVAVFRAVDRAAVPPASLRHADGAHELIAGCFL